MVTFSHNNDLTLNDDLFIDQSNSGDKKIFNGKELDNQSETEEEVSNSGDKKIFNTKELDNQSETKEEVKKEEERVQKCRKTNTQSEYADNLFGNKLKLTGALFTKKDCSRNCVYSFAKKVKVKKK